MSHTEETKRRLEIEEDDEGVVQEIKVKALSILASKLAEEMKADMTRAEKGFSFDVKPEGFNDLKIKLFKNIKNRWPKEFPPIEPNTPMWWLVDIMADVLAEATITPLSVIPEEAVIAAIEKFIVDQGVGKMIEQKIDEVVNNQINSYFLRKTEKQEQLKEAFLEDLEKL